MGSVYAWASPTYIVNNLTMGTLRMYLERVPDRHYEDQIMTAQLLALVASIGSKEDAKRPTPTDFLAGYARAAIAAQPKRYSPEVTASIRFGAKFALFPQEAIDLIDWDAL